MNKQKQREVEVVVISDVHLGTYGCHAKELLQYLRSINPQKVILNGDIIDMWQFSKRYWPKSHMQIIKHLTGWMVQGVEIIYIPGNHDEMMRRFSGIEMGNFRVANKVLLNNNGKKAWIFHGDVFDITMQHSRWLAKLGATGYDLLILLNRFVNLFSEKLGRGRISLSKRIKDSVKQAVKFINDFEHTAAEIGIDNGYDYVICGHIHKPEYKTICNANGSIVYLNSGDWIENLTTLEYNHGKWQVYYFHEDELANTATIYEEAEEPDHALLFQNLIREFKIQQA